MSEQSNQLGYATSSDCYGADDDVVSLREFRKDI